MEPLLVRGMAAMGATFDGCQPAVPSLLCPILEGYRGQWSRYSSHRYPACPAKSRRLPHILSSHLFNYQTDSVLRAVALRTRALVRPTRQYSSHFRPPIARYCSPYRRTLAWARPGLAQAARLRSNGPVAVPISGVAGAKLQTETPSILIGIDCRASLR